MIAVLSVGSLDGLTSVMLQSARSRWGQRVCTASDPERYLASNMDLATVSCLELDQAIGEPHMVFIIQELDL